jgi:uncharacterized membrane protein YqjE
MLEIILLVVLILLVTVFCIMSLGLLIAYATQHAYDAEKDINDDE